MIPIYEQGSGKGIGHCVDSFMKRFREICDDLVRQNGSHTIAFLLYDLKDNSIRDILKDQGVFTKLDRLAGSQLSVFYLHSGTEASVDIFNEAFLGDLAIGQRPNLPCVIFVKYNGQEFSDISIAYLDSLDLIHGFNELIGVFSRYIEEDRADQPLAGDTDGVARYTSVRWINGASRYVTVEFVKNIIRQLTEHLPLN